MEKNTLLRWTVLLVMATAFLTMAARVSITHTASYDQSNVNIGTDTLGGVTYTTVNYAGLYNGGAPGAPSLPIDFIRFSVPYNASNFSVTVSPSSAISLQSEIIYPCQPPRMMNDTTPLTITLPDSSIYYSNTSYPSQLAWVVDEGFLAGENHIVTVAVLPWYYKHATRPGMVDMLKLYRSVSLILSYDVDGTPTMFPIVRQDTALRSEGYRLTQEMVVNPSRVKANAPSHLEMIDPGLIVSNLSGDGLNGGGFEPRDSVGNLIDTLIIPDPIVQSIPDSTYLIVTTGDLYHSIQRLAALKRQQGYSVRVVTMDEVKNSPHSLDGDRIKQPDGTYKLAFKDDAGKLRHFLKYYYINYGTRYVLLAGDGVPYKDSTIYIENKPINFQSDLYFGELNSDWSSGTITKDPELFVGRILAKSAEQINNYTDKLMRYTINPGRGDTGYLNRAFYSQGYDMRIKHEVDTLRVVLDSIYPNPFVMQESDDINDKSKFPSGRDIINEINNTQYGFLSLHHHGYPSGLLTYGFRRGSHADKYRFLWSIDSVHIANTGYLADDTLSINGLNNMANKWYPNICYSIACSTIPYKLDSFYSGLPMVFGESFTTGKDYGGPVFIGNTNNGYSPSSSRLERSVARELIRGNYKIGSANSFGKSAYNGISSNPQVNIYVVMVQNLLGDPSLEVWTGTPQVFSGIGISRTDNSITVSGFSTDSVKVTYCYKGYYKSMLAGPQNITFNRVSPNGMIMLSKHNYLPYIAPLSIQNESINKSQYVIASDVAAGCSVDNGRTSGDVTVKNGVEYEIEASGTVTLESGFNVEKGATFAVYPSCF